MQESLTQRIDSADTADEISINDLLKRISGNCDMGPESHSDETFCIKVERGYEKEVMTSSAH